MRGTRDFTLECRPRFDYGPAEHQLEFGEGENRGLSRSGMPATTRPCGDRCTTIVVIFEGPGPALPGPLSKGNLDRPVPAEKPIAHMFSLLNHSACPTGRVNIACTHGSDA